MNWYSTLKKIAIIEDGPRAALRDSMSKMKQALTPLKSDPFVKQHIYYDALRKMFMQIDGSLTNAEESVNRSDWDNIDQKLGSCSVILDRIANELNMLAQRSNYRFDFTEHPAVIRFNQMNDKLYNDCMRLKTMNPAPQPIQPQMGNSVNVSA